MPPVIQQIANEQRQYQVNVGKAMDVLRRDMQDILTKKPGKSVAVLPNRNESSRVSYLEIPLYKIFTSHAWNCFYPSKNTDYSIYTDDIQIVDPSGVQLTGLTKYQSAFSFFQTFVNFWFRPKSSGVQFRMVYDFARSSIRISWHAVLVPKVSLLGAGRPLHVDGISYYSLDRESGLIHEHRIENLSINNTPVVPPYGIWSLLQQDALRGLQGGVGVPVGALSSGHFQIK